MVQKVNEDSNSVVMAAKFYFCWQSLSSNAVTLDSSSQNCFISHLNDVRITHPIIAKLHIDKVFKDSDLSSIIIHSYIYFL